MKLRASYYWLFIGVCLGTIGALYPKQTAEQAEKARIAAFKSCAVIPATTYECQDIDGKRVCVLLYAVDADAGKDYNCFEGLTQKPLRHLKEAATK